MRKFRLREATGHKKNVSADVYDSTYRIGSLAGYPCTMVGEEALNMRVDNIFFLSACHLQCPQANRYLTCIGKVIT